MSVTGTRPQSHDMAKGEGHASTHKEGGDTGKMPVSGGTGEGQIRRPAGGSGVKGTPDASPKAG